VVTLAEFDNNLTVRREGTGTVKLTSTIHDPVADIQIDKIRSASYVEGDLIARAKSIGTIPKDQFFPYLLGRMDDWSQLNTENDIQIK
jgi:hypothetical protein